MATLDKTKIMVFGTFDVLHQGHLSFFKQARALAKNSFLIVSVARDKNVKKIKGRLPFYKEKRRLKNLQNLQMVDTAILGGLGSHLPHILKQKPDIIALGYDQKAYTADLKKLLSKNGLNVKIYRLKAFKPYIYKSSKTRLYEKKTI